LYRKDLATVVYDPDAAAEFAMAVKSKDERKALLNAVDKLRRLGEQLVPPHMKPLRGAQASELRELRPRQGRSDWRAVYARSGNDHVVLPVCRHDDMGGVAARRSGPCRPVPMRVSKADKLMAINRVVDHLPCHVL
jgi:hypothetical protein